ncbi:MAG: hypothetical protein HC828_12570 [Blastochloris sp.]|nr:hypothetical protein [Blastochloris sp.]
MSDEKTIAPGVEVANNRPVDLLKRVLAVAALVGKAGTPISPEPQAQEEKPTQKPHP